MLNKLRKKRNAIVHERDSITSDESFGCLRVAVVIIINRMNDLENPFSKIEENNLVELWHCRESSLK